MGGYLDNNLKPKGLTTGPDIARGAVGLPNIDPPLFLQLQLVKLHTHQGSDSRSLGAGATPEMVKGYRPKEREEHATSTWTGGAAASGSIELTFGTPFQEVPDVLAMVSGQSGANLQVTCSTPTKTGVILYWKDDTASTHTSVPITWLAKGR